MDLQMKYGKWAPLSARLGPLLSRGAEAAVAAAAPAEDGLLVFSVAEVLTEGKGSGYRAGLGAPPLGVQLRGGSWPTRAAVCSLWPI